jgi:hypothetical protein
VSFRRDVKQFAKVYLEEALREVASHAEDCTCPKCNFAYGLNPNP